MEIRLELEPIKLTMSEGDSEVVLKVNSNLGVFTLVENEDLLAEEETSYFNLDKEECTIDRCRLTPDEKMTAMYFLFTERLIELLTSGSSSCKRMTMKGIVLGDNLVGDTLIEFYCKMVGENFMQVRRAIYTCLEQANHFEVTPTAGGLLQGVEEHYLSTGHTLVTSSHGIALLQDKSFIDLRLFDTGDVRWAPINFYSKFTKFTTTLAVKTRVLRVLKLYALGCMVNNIPELGDLEEECLETLTNQLVNIYWRLGRG